MRCRARRRAQRVSVRSSNASGTPFLDARFEIEHLASDGVTVVCVGTMSGSHEGTLLGVQATGRKVEWRQCHLYRSDGSGRAVEHDAIRDGASLLRQFAEGATTTPARR